MTRKLEQWLAQIDCTFQSINEMLSVIIEDAGIDLSSVKMDELKAALEQKPNVNWFDIGFGCAEVLNDYAFADELDGDTIIKGFCVTLLLALSIEKGFSDWEFHFSKVITLLYRSSQNIVFLVQMELLEIVCVRWLDTKRTLKP